MRFVRALTALLSAPLLWLGQLTFLLRMPVSASLLKAAWAACGLGERARLALAAVQAFEGPQAAIELAQQWLQRRPSPEIAGFAALLLLQYGQGDAAAALLARGRELGQDADGMLDLAEFILASRTGGPQAAAEVARRFEDRRDLSATVSQLVLTELAWDALLDRRFDEAKRRARHLLEVSDHPPAEIVLWTLALHEDRPELADAYLRRSGPADAQRQYYQALGLAVAGREEESRQMLDSLAEENLALSAAARDVLSQRGVTQWT